MCGFPKNVKKSKAYLTLVPNGKNWSTLTTIDKAAHRVKRKVVSQAFTDDALTEFELAIHKHIDLLHDIVLEGTELQRAGRRARLCTRSVR